jgi:hypothetical protein
MPVLKRFSTPARQNDFPNNPTMWERMQTLWNTNVDGINQQAVLGNPWNQVFTSPQNWWYHPLTTDVPEGVPAAAITWIAFPNRLVTYFGSAATGTVYPNNYNFDVTTLFAMADTGQYNGGPFPQIPVNRCTGPNGGPQWDGPLQSYGPFGPRGWMDEYCEFSVTRRATDQKIVRVDFTCENPEYWYTLWRLDPTTAAQVVQDTLNQNLTSGPGITVTVADLTLYDPTTGQPVIDPSTGSPAYNPLHKWNNGTVSDRVWAGNASDTGGAMHLTSTPNTLQTEVTTVGAGGTVQRLMGNAQPQPLVCCSQYGQNFRNSDPHIGQVVNQLVGNADPNNVISLADPQGLYIQQPTADQFKSQFKLPANAPAGASAAECWQIIRGKETLFDDLTGEAYPGNFILHVAFQIPESWLVGGADITVSDIQVVASDNKFYPIKYASQIQQQFHIGLFGRAFPPGFSGPTFYGPTGLTGATSPRYPCLISATAPVSQPLQMMYLNLWNAYLNTNVPNPMGFTMNLAGNTLILPPMVPQGASAMMALITALGNTGATSLPQVFFESGVSANVIGVTGATSTVPGNTMPSLQQVITLQLNVGATAPLGLQGVIIVQRGDNPSTIEPAPAFLNIVGPSGATGS